MKHLLLGLWLALSGPTSVRVIDGDTFEMSGRIVRLEGIDAPELDQPCNTSQGLPWPCGRVARVALRLAIGNAEPACFLIGHDRWGRSLGRCTVHGDNLNSLLVRQGWAFAFVRYSRDYLAAETLARLSRRGIFSGGVSPPWVWRKRQATETKP